MRQPVPFGKYLLLDRVSVGGMAEVFKAKSYGVEGFEKIIAIKRILPAMGEDKDFIKMFIDEAKIAGQLSHANICHIFELGKIHGSHFIAMEYIWGKDLLQIQNRLRKVGHVMPVGMACYVMSKVCEGLDYAHRKKDAMGRPLEIIHRDCSPQNILVSYEGEVKIIDFGIARAASRSSRTNAGVLKGKFGYMSPEQVRGLPLDHRSDIFAVGTCFYESLTGERLFLGESDFSTLEKVRNADVRPPSQLNQHIPPEVEAIVMRSLTRDPKARFESGAEMHAELQAFLTRQSVPFTSKTLADWVKGAFRDDLEREKQLMEEYKRIGRDGLIAGAPQARAKVDLVAELGQPPPIEGDPTTLGGPRFEDMSQDELDAWLSNLPSGPPAPPAPPPAQRAAAPIGPRGKVLRSAVEGDWEPEEAPTEVFGEIGIPTPPGTGAARPGGPPAVPSVIGPSMLGPPAMPGATGDGGYRGTPPASVPLGNPRALPADLQGRSEHPTMLDGAAPALPHGGAPPSFYPVHNQYQDFGGAPYSPYPPPPPDRGSMRPPTAGGARWRRATATRDIAIGCAIAALVVAGIVSAKFLLFGDEPRAEAETTGTGTILVVVRDRQPAEVSVDGKVAGAIRDQTPLSLSSLPPGPHTVQVTRAGEPPCDQKVELSPRQVAVVECAFRKAPTYGYLTLEGVESSHRVFVDDQEISSEAAREELHLTPGVEHAIQIKTGAAAPETLDEFSVELQPGEKLRRAIKTGKGGSGDKDRDSSRSGRSSRDDDEDEDADDPESEPPRRARAASAPAVAADTPGSFSAFTQPFARVFIDGKDTGKMTPIAPRSAISLPPGKHDVTFVVGEQRFSYRITIAPGERTNLVKTLRVE